MSKDNKKVLLYTGFLLVMDLITYKLPHDSYNIMQYIIKPIPFKDGWIYPSNIIMMLLFIIGIAGMVRTDRFKYKNKIISILIIAIIFIPLMYKVLDISRTCYHTIRKDGLNSFDIEKAYIFTTRTNDKLKLGVNMKLINYGGKPEKFKIRVYLPDTLSDCLGRKVYELNTQYSFQGNGTVFISDYIDIDAKGKNIQDLIFSREKWEYELTKYELYNNHESVIYLDHGL